MRIRTGMITVVLVVAAIFIAAPAQAQNKLGVIAGVNLASVSFDPSAENALEAVGVVDGESKGKTGFAVGISFERPITPKLNLRIHGMYRQGGFGLTGEIPLVFASPAGARPSGIEEDSFQLENNLTFNEFVIDALANLPVGAAARFSINAGLYFAFLMSNSEEFTIDGEDITDDPEFVETDVSSSEVGLAVGPEFKITNKVIVGALFRLGFSDRDDSPSDERIFTSAKTRALMIYVLFLFGGGI